jgi:hypothetical protein
VLSQAEKSEKRKLAAQKGAETRKRNRLEKERHAAAKHQIQVQVAGSKGVVKRSNIVPSSLSLQKSPPVDGSNGGKRQATLVHAKKK